MISIETQFTELKIGNNKITIKDRFTLIMGKFKTDSLKQYQKDNIYNKISNFTSLPIENFAELYENQAKKYRDLYKSKNILIFLKDYSKIANLNSNLILQFTTLIQSLISSIKYKDILHKKEILLNELELSKIRDESSVISAKTDLLNKLNESINHNKKKLKFREEDFLFLKIKRDQYVNNINNYKLKIQDLTNKKKESFTQINKITREMSNPLQDQKEHNKDLKSDEYKDLTKSERIKALQTQAKEIQHEINQINSKINETQLKLDGITPNYNILKKDYQTLFDSLKNDEESLESIQIELEEKIKEKNFDSLIEFDFKDLNSIKQSYEIESEIQEIESGMDNILEFSEFLDKENPEKMSKILDKLNDIEKELISKKDSYSIPYRNKEITESIENYRKLETIMNYLEVQINKFLIKVNLKVHYQILVSNDLEDLFINTEFIRLNKESLVFEELTTPEKIFYVISLYIAFKIQVDSKFIILSNIFIPKTNNKRGSIFRAIQRIL
ncbi:MAG: coiled-coil domain-containing protein, partial [Promethearchaeota archaeon]